MTEDGYKFITNQGWPAELGGHRKQGDETPRKKFRVDLGDNFAELWRRLAPADCPQPEREYRFCPSRKWRFDCAWPHPISLAVEMEGSIWAQGRHTRGAGYQADMLKYNAAGLMGFLILRYSADDLKKRPLQVIAEIAQAIRERTPRTLEDE